ncbi:hypothetical protein, variant [Verruconis gallopava]|nr:hypothetical protein, variant [Verruconis gallopava]KIW00370.1 hypothetical protein, variant [Verruconis gallopava]
MPTSEGAIHASQATNAPLHGFQPQTLAPQVFHNPNPFSFHAQPSQHVQAFPPHQFGHHPSGFDAFAHPGEPPKHDEHMRHDVEMQETSPTVPFVPQAFDATMQPAPPVHQPPMNNFRYHVTLNAPTAMIKHASEIPVTYLNKGQAYSISIVDTQPSQISALPVTYRTYVRISFEDEQQRQKPAACWQLWKEGRGSSEAHQRGGRLQAVEFVDQTQVGGLETAGRPRIELESSSFDGFSVTWTPAPNAPPECVLAVRFNFLSTDFSHSKGVKGIPVRLCAKTELRHTQPPPAPEAMNAEICYCKVKLFRDHGAERKLSNDVAHVKKSIDKLKQQIAQIEAGVKDHGKRKRSGSIAKGDMSSRPGKVPKHKRTWSMSSASSTGARGSHEDELQLKLAALQDMFTSTRPQSVLYLRGEEDDDPDLHPIQLVGGDLPDLTRVHTGDSSAWEQQSAEAGHSSMVSPTPSNQSIPSNQRRESRRESDFSMPSLQPTHSWQQASAHGESSGQGSSQFGSPNVPVKVPKAGGDQAGSLTGWIEALGVDYTYQPPPERPIKPVACFYVQPRFTGRVPEDNYYRAIYVMQRTLKDLINGIAAKCNVEPTKVLRTLRINKQGLNILLDDESVVELPEGQDMIAEFLEIRPHSPMKREWDSGPTDIQVDGDIDIATTVQSEGYELRLLY